MREENNMETIVSGLINGLAKPRVSAPRNQWPRIMSLLGHGTRRRFWLGMALLVLAGWPLVGHAGGLITAWGGNSGGQNNVPPNVTNVLAIAAGTGFSLALKADHTVAAWGTNIVGETAVPSDLTNATAIAAGFAFGLALKPNGTVAAWGDNTYGETDVPAGLSNVVAIAAGWYHGLVLKADGTVVARGSSSYGETNVPPNLTDVVGIAAGAEFSLALKRDGTAKRGATMTTTATSTCSSRPSLVPGIRSITTMATARSRGSWCLRCKDSTTMTVGGSSGWTTTTTVTWTCSCPI